MLQLKDNTSYILIGDDRRGYRLEEASRGSAPVPLSREEKLLLDEVADVPSGNRRDVLLFPEGSAQATSVLKRSGRRYWTQNTVGCIQHGGHELIVTSRFSQKGAGGLSGDFFFNYMLERSMHGFCLMQPKVSTAHHGSDAFSLYGALFVGLLKRALRKGIVKEYVRKPHNDSNVRGALDIPRHVALNTPFVGNVAYVQREHSYDNRTTQLIRHTIEFLRSHPQARRWLEEARPEIKQMADATPTYRPGDLKRIIEANRNDPMKSAYYSEYEELRLICLQILQHQSFVYGKGDGRAHGILFDCAALWENYLAHLLEDAFHHTDNVNGEGEQHLFRDDRSGGAACVPIYPDFISRSSQPRAIADAKYKSIDFRKNEEKDRADFYQVLSYLYRFESPLGFLLYPCKPDERKMHTYSMLKGIDGFGEGGSSDRKGADKVRLIKLGLQVPSQEGISYERFSEEMTAAADGFKRTVARMLSEAEEAEKAGAAKTTGTAARTAS